VAFDITQDLGYVFPDFRREGPRGGDQETADQALEWLCWEALAGRYAGEPEAVRAEARRRLREELEIVRCHRLSGFFLLPRDIREELIREVHRRYGDEHVAMVATFPTYRLRSAVREVGKALGLPAADVDRLARLSEGGDARTVEAEMRRLPGFEQAVETAP